MSFKIEQGNSFNTVEDKIGLLEYKEAIEYYFENFENAIELKNDIPIFLDTNVLLRFYSISFKQRALLKKFFTERKKQIIISKQVQKEFIKNREDVIEKYFETALGGLSEQFKTEVINRITKFKQEHQEIIKDFDFLEDEINSQEPKLNDILEKLKEEIETKRKENKKIKFQDDTLNLFSSFEQLENLDKEELSFLTSEFDSLKKDIDPSKIKSEIKKTNKAFPGMGDIQDKPENPYGDYLLFHEMIKYSNIKDSDLVFLTYDTTKGDWIKSNKEPHIHYIHRVFKINKKSIFIIDANSFFEKLFSTSFDSLIPEKRIDYYSIESDLEKEIIIEFIGLERIIRTIAEFVVIEDSGSIPLIKILKEFNGSGYLSMESHFQLLDAIQIRNELTHRDKEFITKKYDKATLRKSLKVIQDSITLMNKLYEEL